MKIGILQTGKVPDVLVQEHGEYPQMFAQLLDGHGFEFEFFAVVDNQLPSGPEAADGWLITGSRHGVYEDHPWIAPLETLIRGIVAADRPLVGVCFGHQIIAQALGGKVAKFAGGWAVGPQAYDFPQGTRCVHAWHQDQVLTPPNGAITVASNAFCKHAALLYPGKAYSVQPHPEFSDPYLIGLLEKRGPGIVPDDVLEQAGAATPCPLDSADVIEELAQFLRTKRLASDNRTGA